MYIVIQLQGHQYIIKQGDTITVDKIEGDVSAEAKVIMAFDETGKNVYIGRPYLENIILDFEIKTQKRGEKMHITKFHRKNRYERRIGFKSYQTVLTINNISING